MDHIDPGQTPSIWLYACANMAWHAQGTIIHNTVLYIIQIIIRIIHNTAKPWNRIIQLYVLYRSTFLLLSLCVVVYVHRCSVRIGYRISL